MEIKFTFTCTCMIFRGNWYFQERSSLININRPDFGNHAISIVDLCVCLWCFAQIWPCRSYFLAGVALFITKEDTSANDAPDERADARSRIVVCYFGYDWRNGATIMRIGKIIYENIHQPISRVSSVPAYNSSAWNTMADRTRSQQIYGANFTVISMSIVRLRVFTTKHHLYNLLVSLYSSYLHLLLICNQFVRFFHVWKIDRMVNISSAFSVTKIHWVKSGKLFEFQSKNWYSFEISIFKLATSQMFAGKYS